MTSTHTKRDGALAVEWQLAHHLDETPLAEDQTITWREDGTAEIQATVLETAQLHWWLLGLGAAVRVLEPGHLRDMVAEEAERMAALYKG